MSSVMSHGHIHYMDAARGVLMSLGVLLHAANVFSDADWAIQNAQTSIIFTHLIDFIHQFRMPAFFIVSGFFCHLSLQRYGHQKFINKRIPRILIPMFVTVLSLNILQSLILAKYHSYPVLLLDSDYWLSGKWVSHLWFLHCILIYFAVSALIYRYSLKPVTLFASSLKYLMLKSRGLFLLVLPLGTMITLKLSYLIPDTGYYLLSIAEAIFYSVFFAFGVLIGSHRSLLSPFIKPGVLPCALLLGVFILFFALKDNPSSWVSMLTLYISHLIPWLLCLVCFFIFHSLCNSRSTAFEYLANASYSIYLFHHILIIIFSIIIIPTNINIWLKFVILVSTTYATTIFIHHFFVLKFPLMRFLFNGIKSEPSDGRVKNNQQYVKT